MVAITHSWHIDVARGAARHSVPLPLWQTTLDRYSYWINRSLVPSDCRWELQHRLSDSERALCFERVPVSGQHADSKPVCVGRRGSEARLRDLQSGLGGASIVSRSDDVS